MAQRSKYFQDYMPENICFGCGRGNPEGLQIRSFWKGEEAICRWRSQEKYHGWARLLNGGILATLIDCHCMCTAMAYAYQSEGRALGTEPAYRYATGTLHVRYLLPTPNDKSLELRARVLEEKGRKITLQCHVYAEKTCTAQADVVAIRVHNTSLPKKNNPFA